MNKAEEMREKVATYLKVNFEQEGHVQYQNALEHITNAATIGHTNVYFRFNDDAHVYVKDSVIDHLVADGFTIAPGSTYSQIKISW